MAQSSLRVFSGCAGMTAVLVLSSAALGQQRPASPPPIAPVQPAVPAQAAPVVPQAAPAPDKADAGLSDIEERVRRVVGQPGGLTAQEAGRTAAARSLSARSAQADITSASADVNKVIYGGLPRLDLTARYTRLSEVDLAPLGPSAGSLVVTPEGEGPLPPNAQLIGVPASVFTFPQILNQYLLQASLNVPISDYVFSLSKAYSAAKHNKRAAELNERAARLDASNRARNAYYEWVNAVLQSLVAEQSLSQAKASLDRSRVAYDVGRIPKADLSLAESVLSNAELTVTRAKTQARLAEQRLRIAMRDESTRAYSIGENVLDRPEDNAEREDFNRLMSEALKNRMEIRAIDETNASLQEQSKVVSARGIPRLDAFANGYYARPNQRFIPLIDEWRASWDAGLQLTWSPNDWGTSSADAARIDAERAKLQVQREQLVDGLRQEVLEAHAVVQEAEIAFESAQQGLRAAEEAYRSQRVLYDNGRTTNVDLLVAETQLLQARIEMVRVLVTLRASRSVLEHAVGRDVPPEWRPRG